jgi:hypothetical protein
LTKTTSSQNSHNAQDAIAEMNTTHTNTLSTRMENGVSFEIHMGSTLA